MSYGKQVEKGAKWLRHITVPLFGLVMVFALWGSAHSSGETSPVMVSTYNENISVIESAPPVRTPEEQILYSRWVTEILLEEAHAATLKVVTPTPVPTVYVPPKVVQTAVPIRTATPVPTASAIVRQADINTGDLLWQAVNTYFPEQSAKAYRVFMCESGGNPTAVSPNGLYWGVAQQDVNIWGYPPPDVMGQVAKARQIYNLAGGWWPWPVCGLK